MIISFFFDYQLNLNIINIILFIRVYKYQTINHYFINFFLENNNIYLLLLSTKLLNLASFKLTIPNKISWK